MEIKGDMWVQWLKNWVASTHYLINAHVEKTDMSHNYAPGGGLETNWKGSDRDHLFGGENGKKHRNIFGEY